MFCVGLVMTQWQEIQCVHVPTFMIFFFLIILIILAASLLSPGLVFYCPEIIFSPAEFLVSCSPAFIVFHLLFQTASSRPGCRPSITCCPQERWSSGADLHSTLGTQRRAIQWPEDQTVTEQKRGLEERWSGWDLEGWRERRMVLDSWGEPLYGSVGQTETRVSQHAALVTGRLQSC